jgi:hypothetical protein
VPIQVVQKGWKMTAMGLLVEQRLQAAANSMQYHGWHVIAQLLQQGGYAHAGCQNPDQYQAAYKAERSKVDSLLGYPGAVANMLATANSWHELNQPSVEFLCDYLALDPPAAAAEPSSSLLGWPKYAEAVQELVWWRILEVGVKCDICCRFYG